MGITIAQWQPEYESGDALVDEQHQSLFSIINSLNNALLEGCGEELLEQTLQNLKEYTTLHFDTEEQFMVEHGYPDYAEHHRKHELLKARVLEFERDKQQDVPKVAIAVSHFLADWLIHHIKTEDKRMIRFCRQGQWTEGKREGSQTPISSASNSVLAPWRPEYETGYILIDDQHRSLFHSINALHSAMLNGRAEQLLDRTLKSLRSYVTIHFETEQQFMLKYGYPGYLEHKEKHDLLRKEVAQFSQEEHQQNKSKLTINVSHFLTNWLIQHIKNEDQKMITFLRQERQKEQAKRTLGSF